MQMRLLGELGEDLVADGLRKKRTYKSARELRSSACPMHLVVELMLPVGSLIPAR